MRTQADTGFGAKFEVLTATGPDVWTRIGELNDLQPPEISRDTHDATHYESDDGYREFIPGLKDGGEATIEYNLIPGGTTDDQVQTLMDDDDLQKFRVVFPNAAKLTFDGFVTTVGRATPMDDKMTGSATIKVSGKPALTDA